MGRKDRRDETDPLGALPRALRVRAEVSAGGVCTWDRADLDDVLETARALYLAVIAGCPLVELPQGACSLIALRWRTSDRAPGELWSEFVRRAAREASGKIATRWSEPVLRECAAGVRFVRSSGLDPVERTRVALQFRRADGTIVPPPPPSKPANVPRASMMRTSWYLAPPVGIPLAVLAAAVHPVIGGLVLTGALFASLAAAVDLAFLRPDLRKPQRSALLLWNVCVPVVLCVLLFRFAATG